MTKIELFLTDRYVEFAEVLFDSINDIVENEKSINNYIIIITTLDDNIYEIDIKNVSFLGFFNTLFKIKVLDEIHIIKYDFINMVNIVPKE